MIVISCLLLTDTGKNLYNNNMKRMPIVALIGQTNAGKSSILNRMAKKNIAIVACEEGTTRDNVVATIDDAFILIDTAGLKDPSDDFEASIQDQINDAIEAADVILVTLDSTKYFDQKDARIAKNALKSKKPVLLVLNKCDLGESLPIEEFRALGIAPENIYYTSATTGQGVDKLKKSLGSVLLRASGGYDRGMRGAPPVTTGRSDPGPKEDVSQSSIGQCSGHFLVPNLACGGRKNHFGIRVMSFDRFNCRKNWLAAK